MLNFCTLFNSAYLSRGVAMYQSLEKHCEHFHLYILAFDDDCFSLLNQLHLKHASIVSLNNFENPDLIKAKSERTLGEYCWTCTPSIIAYCIQKYALPHCIYIDADLLFFNDPKVLIDEMGDKSVLITEHRYTSEYDQSEMSGKYCVQFVCFKNNTAGLHVLNWWKDACINWCYNRVEDGKFGDQKYLDHWTSQFPGIHVLEHLGGGVAPWNVQQYKFTKRKDKIIGLEIATSKKFDLIFYHFHDFRYCIKNTFRITAVSYFINRNSINKIYKSYINSLFKATESILKVNPLVRYHEPEDDLSWINKSVGRQILFFLKGYYKNFYTSNKVPKSSFLSQSIFPKS